eukprot:7559365-Alexandrium_andersonii.AAC.1
MSAHVTQFPQQHFPCLRGAPVADTEHLVNCRLFGGPIALGPGGRVPRAEETRLAAAFVPRPAPVEVDCVVALHASLVA